MSNVIAIQQFLVGKTFAIPAYQRDYAWSTAQVEDLFEDISEAIVTQSSHYLGTVVLARNGAGPHEVVDGQQRLCTLTLVIHALLDQLAPDDAQRIADTAILLRHGLEMKLHFGNNAVFVSALLSNEQPMTQTAGQRKLQAAYRYACGRAKALVKHGGRDAIIQWLDTLKTLEVIEYVAPDTGRAIRMFQTVNDRGLPLSAMDKAKALLVFYSNRHLSGALDARINEAFGICYAAFDAMREFVTQPALRIDNIARDAFSEDDLLRYHYLAYDYPGIVNGGDWVGSLRTVFDGFLKATLKHFSQDTEQLSSFIADYVEDLSSFCAAFRDMVSESEHNPRLYKYMVVLGVSTRLYPLTVRLYQRHMLLDVPPGNHADLLKCLETCDVRVYKTRGTEPAKHIGRLSHKSRNATANDIADAVGSFTSRFMPDGYFQTQLGQDMYHNQALTLMMVEYDEHCAGVPHDASNLRSLVTAKITREHILSQTPSFSVTAHGFDDDVDFIVHLNQIGNLTPLSKGENSKCANASVHSKMTDPALYTSSRFAATRSLAHSYMSGTQRFQKADLQERTNEMSSWVLQTWALW